MTATYSSMVIHPYEKEWIKRNIIANTKGNYILGTIDKNGEFIPGYVGRSDCCLKTRLLTHNHFSKYSAIVIKFASTEIETFLTECKWYHDLRSMGIKLENKIHPDSPDYGEKCCPYCEFKALMAS